MNPSAMRPPTPVGGPVARPLGAEKPALSRRELVGTKVEQRVVNRPQHDRVAAIAGAEHQEVEAAEEVSLHDGDVVMADGVLQLMSNRPQLRYGSQRR